MRKLMPLVLVVGLSACTLGPNHVRPETDLPAGWAVPAAGAPAAPAGTGVDSSWWRAFNDPSLTGLVEEALQHNADLSLAAARIAEARAVLNLRDAERYPLLSGQASGARQQGSAETAQPGGGVIYNNFGISAVLNYEVDLWGRLARASEAARAQLLAGVASRDAIRLAVAADVASGYFNLRALDQQLAIAERTVQTREGSYRFQESRYRNGAISQLVFRQAESELAAARAELPALRQQRVLQINALSVLLGRTPREIVQQGIPGGRPIDELPAMPEVPMGLPSALLERRPDIRAAEEQLRAANAEIGIARAAYFPTLSLTGLFGSQSDELSNLFNGPAKTWQFGGNLAGPLIDFGRTRANVRAAEARRQQALVNYQQTVRIAFREVLDALESRSATSERLVAQEQQVTALRETARLAQRRFDEGYSDYLEVLDAQRSLFTVELARVTTQQQRLRALVDLYKALGGGWQVDTLAQAER
jgi:multidrug efflux system outer membrane protein